MTKLFLAAGVAALAITAPVTAAPGGHGGKDKQDQRAQGGADRNAQRSEMRAQRVENRSARADRRDNRVENRSARMENRNARVETRVARSDNRNNRVEARAARIENRNERVDARSARIENRRNDDRRVVLADRSMDRRLQSANGAGLIDGCPPGLAKKGNGCLPPGQAKKMVNSPIVTAQRAAILRDARVDNLNRRLGYNLAAPITAASLLGMPINQANSVLPLSPVPNAIRYLYPSNAMYDYRYGDGYIYQVDKTSNLISSLIPLLAGGYLPGQTLPQMYMNSAVPNYYGYNSFYPNYDDQCTRYANGVVYYVDCGSGVIENIMPVYDSGYGVGQLLPSSYGYYNVPSQYRPYYYDTADTGYWYAPGAIYQYDPKTSLITSVAALLSPGMTVGQPMPTGYGVYNVPMGFRDTYYDTPNAWYRYSNGNIYQVDPVTQLVTSIVASALS